MINWASHQLTEYLLAVSGQGDANAAMRSALEHSLDALDAELGVVVDGSQVLHHVGFGRGGVPDDFVTGIASSSARFVTLAGIPIHIAQAWLGSDGRTHGLRLIVGRMDVAMAAIETQIVQTMGLILGLALNNLRALEMERAKNRLVQTLLSIQRMISTRRPLQELFDGVTSGASALLGGQQVALYLVDSAAPDTLLPVSTVTFAGLESDLLDAAHRTNSEIRYVEVRLDEGSRLIVARVEVEHSIAGFLVARVDRDLEDLDSSREMLCAFAQQVSLALTDQRTLDAIEQAHHDTVTGLPNRALFLQGMEQWHAATHRGSHPLTVLFIDLDRFKAVNDTLGHAAGDQLLAEVGRRVKNCIRGDDVASRLGGDEFAVLLTNLSTEAACRVADRIIDNLRKPFVIGGHEVVIGASVGIATSTGQSATALLSDADVAMYQAKRSGGCRSLVFEQRMLDDVAHQLALRTDLEHALELDQFWLAYQPIVSLSDGRVQRLEALTRWRHPQRGLVMPGEFIPVAEESDAIVVLGEWAAHRGLADLAAWRHTWPDLGLCLNASVRQLMHPGYPEMIARALQDHGIPGAALTLEITESSFMTDPELAGRQLATLRRLGVRVAIDDFGTGYSALAYVRRFPVDEVKLDRSFVSGLDVGTREDLAVVNSVVTLCNSLRLSVVAEGIENPEQLQALQDLGCGHGQGYLLSRPLAAADCERFLTGHRVGPRQPAALAHVRQLLPPKVG